MGFFQILLWAIFCLTSLGAESWVEFKETFSKSYSGSTEEELRRRIFEENVKLINEHNSKYASGAATFTAKVNEFADMTNREFLRFVTGHKMSLESHKKATTFVPSKFINTPDEIDWYEIGGVTPVKNQGFCAASWAFGIAGSLEGQFFRLKGKTETFSAQHLIDCCDDYGNLGCHGGDTENAYAFLLDEGALLESSYPYMGKKSHCDNSALQGEVNVTGFVHVPFSMEEELMVAVATVGPIVAVIDGSSPEFQFYAQGVYSNTHCSSIFLNHVILITGYGTEGGVSYWKFKNSWGESWGDNGFGKLLRGNTNHCGVSSKASYPML